MDKLAQLRKVFDQKGVTGFIIPSNDEFMGEYTPPSAKRLEWLTGFTGSAGIALITNNEQIFFTDGRYILQAEKQLSDFSIINSGLMRPFEWAEKNLTKGDVLGYDPSLITRQNLENFRLAAEKTGFKLKPVANPIDKIWQGRPKPPGSPAKIHALEYSGEEAETKRLKIARELQEKNIDAAVLTLPDSICWLLNIRGKDVPHTPFVLAYALIHKEGNVDLYIDLEKITKEVKEHLGSGVNIHKFKDMVRNFGTLKNKRILIDPAKSASWFFDLLKKSGAEIIEGKDPCQLAKACKNKVEIEGARAAHIRDGVAVVRFLHWLSRQDEVSEILASDKLEEFRKEGDLFQGLSFDTISGFAENGAIVHYHADEKSNKMFEPDGLYLVDSGGQYLDGTTDITRTIAIGKPTDEQKDRFTRVLKGHIALARTKFPEKTTGAALDALARYHLWQEGLDYDHGTGHGVGSYLSVHEGPQGISRAYDQALLPGMIISNEPGYYKEGEYGIRIENLVVVKECEKKAEAKQYFTFETITMVPIDLNLIEKALLTADEIEWLNAYHRTVREALSEFLDKESEAWLKSAAAAI